MIDFSQFNQAKKPAVPYGQTDLLSQLIQSPPQQPSQPVSDGQMMINPVMEPTQMTPAITKENTQGPGLGEKIAGALGMAIFGPPEANMTPEDRGKKQAKRSNAGGMAKSAASDPESMAESFMGPQSGGSGSIIDTIAKISGLFKGI